MKLTIREEADEDALAAALWYESRREDWVFSFAIDWRLCMSRFGLILTSLVRSRIAKSGTTYGSHC